MPEVPATWRNEALAGKWRKVRQMRRVVTGALEIARAEKRIGSSLEAVPVVYLGNRKLEQELAGVDMAEIAITSGLVFSYDGAPADAFRLDDVEVMPGSNLPRRAERLALEWARLRREELRAAWERAKHGQHPGKVAPLP